MHAVDRRQTALAEKIADGLVGGQRGFLDQGHREVARVVDHLDDFVLVVEHELALTRRQAQRTFLIAQLLLHVSPGAELLQRAAQKLQ